MSVFQLVMIKWGESGSLVSTYPSSYRRRNLPPLVNVVNLRCQLFTNLIQMFARQGFQPYSLPTS
ncbi:MAG TPA: hypothetical protein DDW50_12565 [Firmicutes bacterium]|jgi:hypothetical protein|nr:hypothetical protein [Bacillota bacterium]